VTSYRKRLWLSGKQASGLCRLTNVMTQASVDETGVFVRR
jgi:hypothetical protein